MTAIAPDGVQPAIRVTDCGDGVMLIVFGQDPRPTALSEGLLVEIADALDAAREDVRCCVIAGGTRNFGLGSDLKELKRIGSIDYLTSRRRHAWERIHRGPVPTIAAVAGYALGGACELALTCDLLVAADDARFGQPEARLGIMPGAGGTQRWARLVGRHRATEVIIAGRVIDAWEARRLGIANKVVPHERLIDCAIELARTVAGVAPLSARIAKEGIAAAEEMGLRAGLDHERNLFATLLSSEDSAEGIAAFLDKRAPRYEGR